MNRRCWNDISDNWQKLVESEFGWRFFRRGGCALPKPVIELAGPLRGKRLLDLACGSGEAALSFANRGARVTGVDISERRLGQARLKAARAGLKVDYVRADMVRLPFRGSSFDRVYTGGGITAWIPDADAWAKGIARVLKPGGVFVYGDRHPFLACVNVRGNRLTLRPARGGYLDNRPLSWNSMGRWMRRRRPVPEVERGWTLAHLVNALSGAGLVFAQMRETPVRDHWFRLPPGMWRAFPRDLAMSWKKPS